MDDSNIKLRVYGINYDSIGHFINAYGFDQGQYNKALYKFKHQRKRKYKSAALFLIEKKVEMNKKDPCYAWGIKFDSIADCCRYFRISDTTIYNMMKHNKSVDDCINKLFGKEKEKWLRKRKVSDLINKFIYGHIIDLNKTLQDNT